RFRELAREGFMLLLTRSADAAAAQAAAQDVDGPVRVAELAAVDPTGTLATALDARPGEVWVIRPDAHVAAVVEAVMPDDGRRIRDALDRAQGGPRHGVLPAVG
ncbi:MAG: pentachlorophenol monooxygenase, partial [Pseudonocardia sp.]|nr:pentachlorophenol monooxygenase [Pseudonocardia sp.]